MVTVISCLIWQIISFILPLNEYGCVSNAFSLDRLTEDAYFAIIFSDEAHFDLGGYANKQNCHIWGTENPHAFIEKSIHPKRVTVWCGFWCRGIIGPFFFENEQGVSVTVNGDRYRTMLNKFLCTKIEEENIGNIWPKLHSMFCALFLTIILSATELMSFGHLGASIWHRWTIIYRVPSKISVTPTSQRRYDALKDNIPQAIGEIQLHTIDNVIKIGPIV